MELWSDSESVTMRKMFVPGGPSSRRRSSSKAGWIRNPGFTRSAMISANSIYMWSIGRRPPAIAAFRIRDPSRAKWGSYNAARTTKIRPLKIGYEIQINNRFPDPHPSGSIYGFVDAPKDAQHDDDWNSMDILSRNDKITIRLNGRVVAEHAGDPARPKTGPIGLQLHDQFSIILFRNIRIHENFRGDGLSANEDSPAIYCEPPRPPLGAPLPPPFLPPFFPPFFLDWGDANVGAAAVTSITPNSPRPRYFRSEVIVSFYVSNPVCTEHSRPSKRLAKNNPPKISELS